MNPTLLDPVIDLLSSHAKMPGQVADPPFSILQNIRSLKFAGQTKTSEQRAEDVDRVNTASSWGNETFGVQPVRHLCNRQAL